MKSSAFFLCTELGVAIIAPSGLHFSRAVAMLEKYWVFNFFESSYASWLGSVIRSNIQFLFSKLYEYVVFRLNLRQLMQFS